MEKKKVLFISQEITPYLPESKLSNLGRYLPQGIQELGKEIRTFMPRYGLVNERRNQLHEVIRLSGMNLIINDTDHPLIIKVASIQAARMQVYFIDNEDYFHRKHMFADENGKYFADNDERAIFFAKGVIETVKKLRWNPDIVHCHGWFTSFIPLFLKTNYADEPLFANSKVITSLYDDEFSLELDNKLSEKLLFEDGLNKDDIKLLEKPNFVNLSKLAVNYSDAAIIGSDNLNGELKNYIDKVEKPVLDFQTEETYVEKYNEFYDKILNL